MAQPQFLFPVQAQFRRDNLVLHATARRHIVNQFAGPLSIKTVKRGEVRWNLDGRDLLVDPSTFLILGDGDRYSMNIESGSDVETCCVFFKTGFVEEAAHDATTPLGASLDSPWREAPRLEFIARLHNDADRNLLSRVWSLADRCCKEIQPSSFEEDFLLLAQEILELYQKIRRQISRVPAAKVSTKEELFRRLEIAREYLHGNVDRRVSLEEVSREACVSRYHLHRTFHRVFRLTPHAYITRLRLERARAELANGKRATDAALDAGFTSLSAFTRLFRSRFGIPPSGVAKIRKIGQA